MNNHPKLTSRIFHHHDHLKFLSGCHCLLSTIAPTTNHFLPLFDRSYIHTNESPITNTSSSLASSRSPPHNNAKKPIRSELVGYQHKSPQSPSRWRRRGYVCCGDVIVVVRSFWKSFVDCVVTKRNTTWKHAINNRLIRALRQFVFYVYLVSGKKEIWAQARPKSVA